ncbi:hypothetical protein MKX08_002211 [Trichoderma sp. CBMAI-0020]|nr:hypothetical protein MKX08_002211 [Trichoderma sp. CBMAI-0020]
MAEPSIQDMWEEVRGRFLARTQNSLDFKPPKTIDDVRQMVEHRYDPTSPADSDDNHKRVKEISLTILSCLKLLGGVAAQGAEIVFQPASMCFNAVSLLLDVPKSVHEFHGTIDAVFSIVGPTLSQFKIYERIELFSSIDSELNTAIHKVMISFVDICALSIVLRKGSRWSRFKVATKQTLLKDDSGLKDEIERFEKLIRGQQNVQATLTLEVALSAKADLTAILGKACETGEKIDKIATGISDLKEVESKRSIERTRQKNLAKIQTKFAIDEKTINASKEVCKKIWQQCVTGSGNWLRDLDDYKKWFDKADSEASPLLLLTGEAHSGKSSVMSIIAQELKTAHESAGQSNIRAMVAYYFFPLFSQKADEDKRPAATAIKHIAFQLAEQDSGIANTMATFCDDKHNEAYFRDTSCKDLWHELKIGAPKQGTIYFIIVDGLDGLFEGHDEAANHFLDILETLQSQSSSSADGTRVRVIASGRSDNFQRESLKPTPNIEIEKYNGPDITSYIHEELRKSSLLQGDEEEPKRLRTKVHDRLTTEAKGNFLKVQTALGKIKDLIMSDGSEAEMDNILNESNQDKMKISENVVSELEASLKPQSIEELNELLIWIVYGMEYFDADELEAARFLRFGTASLQKLEDKLKGKYSKLFYMHYNYFALSPNIEPLVIKDRKRPRVGEDAPKISLNITVTNADITTVQNFLWSLFQKSMVDKFEFEPLSNQKSHVTREIQVNMYDAHLAIVKHALRYLTSSPDARTRPIGDNLANRLPSHLNKLSQADGYDEILASDKKEIGDGLFSLFVSGEVIERHWESLKSIIWFGEDDKVEILRKWLQDPGAIGHLGRLDKDWLKTVNTSQRPNRELLTPLMKEIAYRWLQDRTWDTNDCFGALRRFLTLNPLEEESGKGISVSEELERAEKWCQDILLPTSLDSLWYERMGETAKAQSEYKLAISNFKRAIGLENPGFGCFKGLAESYYEKDELLSACSSMEKALSLVKEAESPDNEEMTRIYLRLADWYTQLQQPEGAISHYEHALETCPDTQDALSGILTIRINSGPEEKTHELIIAMNEPNSKQPGLSRLASTLLSQAEDYSYESPLRNLILICSSRQDCMAVLLEAMDQAINAAREQEQEFKLQVLLLHRGVAAIHNGGQNDEALSQAISLWTDCYNITDQAYRRAYDDGVRGSSISSFHYTVIHQLSLHHFEQSIKLQSSPESLSKLVELGQSFRFRGILGITAADTNLAMYYALRGDRAAAKEQLRQYVRISVENLSDETDENDYWAAYTLSKCLLASGDDLNALTAWSLLEPIEKDIVTKAFMLEGGPRKPLIDELTEFVKAKCPLGATQIERIKAVQEELEARMASSQEDDESENSEKQEDIQKALNVLQSALTLKENPANGAGEEAPIAPLDSEDIAKDFPFTCDGTCGATWGFDRALNMCKYCWDLGFCDDCLSLLKDGRLKKIVCNSHHEWLAIPKYSPRGNMAAREGTVQIRGELVKGVRVGGELVTVKEWIGLLKEDWAL